MLLAAAPAQAQQKCPPGQTGNLPYCQVPPPPPPSPACKPKATAKRSIARTSTVGGALDVLAPITSLASGRVAVEYHAAGRHTRFTAPVNSTDGRIRFQRRLPAAQARLGTGIVTIAYAATPTRARSPCASAGPPTKRT